MRWIRNSWSGKRRAAIFRALGWPNLIKARARMAEIRAERKLEQARLEALAQTQAILAQTREDV